MKALAATQGFTARLDVDGRIGALEFQEPFPSASAILGLRIGIAPAAAVAVLPKLVMFHRSKVHGVEHYAAGLPDGCRLGAEFRWGKLVKVSLFELDAKYPDELARLYPAPAGQPGEPFDDPNFKLAVLSALMEAGAIELGSPQELAGFVLRRPVELAKEGHQPIPEAYDYLVRYPLSAADLAKVETLIFDAGNEIYRYCHYFRDGTEPSFNVRSVGGIARCINLRTFNHIGMLERLDAAHLVGLDRLEAVSFECDCLNPERLLELPALKRLTIYRPMFGDGALIAELKQRGIAVGILG